MKSKYNTWAAVLLLTLTGILSFAVRKAAADIQFPYLISNNAQNSTFPKPQNQIQTVPKWS